jgi:rare lipoprotein A
MKNLSAITLYGVVILFIVGFTGCSQKRPSAKIHKKHMPTKYTSAARHRATMRTYRVLGKTYHPSYVTKGQVMRGVSSWYGPNFHGKYTSNGEIYNMHARTAAHKTWPMDTIVKVHNLENDKSTIVRINDRGPFVKGRIIDCSYTAGKELGLDKMGIARVAIEVLGVAGKMKHQNDRAKSKPKAKKIKNSSYGIQIAAFSALLGANKTKLSLARAYPQYTPLIKRSRNASGMVLHKVLLMGFKSENEAENFKYQHGYNHSAIVRN